MLEALPSQLAQGSRGVLRVQLTAPRVAGPLRHRVRVVTDGLPGHDVLDIWLSGHVGADVAVRPATLDLPPGPGGAHATAVLEVTWDRSTLSALTSAAGVRPRARLIGIDGEVQVAPAARSGADGAQVIVTVRRPLKPGRIAAWLELELGRRGPLAVRIRGTVYPVRPEATRGRDR